MARKKSVLILGASRGLGLALAEEYCAVDYEVVATVRTPSPALERLRERFASSLQIKSADTTDPDSIARLKHEFQESEFDTLFVNAGICIAQGQHADRRGGKRFRRVDADECA
jgi:NAD(P)-dependent dehydrogenase (short-subunit alcohol dehydrogenase family)